jgi:hypothetical protein
VSISTQVCLDEAVTEMESQPSPDTGCVLLHLWMEKRIALTFRVDKDSADSTRHLAAMLVGAAEHVDPKGYEIVLPASDVALMASVALTHDAEIQRLTGRRG